MTTQKKYEIIWACMTDDTTKGRCQGHIPLSEYGHRVELISPTTRTPSSSSLCCIASGRILSVCFNPQPAPPMERFIR